MAENESMEGKNLTEQEQIKEQFERVITEIIKNMENDQATIALEGEIKVNIEIKKEKDIYIISMLGEKIASRNEKGEFLYDIEGLQNIKNKLENIAKYEDLGLPDIEYLKHLEKEKAEKTEKKEDEEEREEGNQEKDDEENEEEIEEGEEKEEEEKDDKKPELNKKQSNWIKLDLSAEVVHNTPLRNLIPNSDKYKEIYIVPGKDEYSYTIQGGDKDSGYEVIEYLERTEGRGPTQDVISIENNGEMDVESKQALVMYKIRGKEDEGFSITQMQPGNEKVRMEYWRKAYSDMYISTTVPQANADRGLDRPSPEVKYLMAKNQTSRLEMEKIFETYEKADNLKKQDVPFEANPASDGIELEELDKATFRKRLIEEITEELKEEYGENTTPGFYDNDNGPIKGKAVIIADKILEEGQSYEKAKEEAFKNEKEKGGRTPDQKRKREG